MTPRDPLSVKIGAAALDETMTTPRGSEGACPQFGTGPSFGLHFRF